MTNIKGMEIPNFASEPLQLLSCVSPILPLHISPAALTLDPLSWSEVVHGNTHLLSTQSCSFHPLLIATLLSHAP
jgi:hypothetical protein